MKAPYHWIKGAKPRGRLQYTVAEILSTNLCRTVTAQQLWPDEGSSAPTAHSWLTLATDQQIMDESVRWVISEQPTENKRRTNVPRTEIGLMVRERVDQLQHFDDHTGGAVTLRWLLHDLGWASSLMSDPDCDATVRQEVTGCVADLARATGWLLLDHGQLVQAKSCLYMALRAAIRTGGPSTAAYLVSSLGYVYLWQGMHEQALRLMQIARRGMSGLAPERIHAVLDSRQARVHAVRDELSDARRCIDKAFDLLAECADGPEDSAVRIDSVVILGDAGRSWLDAKLPADAVRDLSAVLRHPSFTCGRHRLLRWASLGHAHFDQGALEGASSAVEEAIFLQQRVRSIRAELRLRGLRRRFAACSSRTARDAVARLDEHFAATPLPSLFT